VFTHKWSTRRNRKRIDRSYGWLMLRLFAWPSHKTFKIFGSNHHTCCFLHFRDIEIFTSKRRHESSILCVESVHPLQVTAIVFRFRMSTLRLHCMPASSSALLCHLKCMSKWKALKREVEFSYCTK